MILYYIIISRVKYFHTVMLSFKNCYIPTLEAFKTIFHQIFFIHLHLSGKLLVHTFTMLLLLFRWSQRITLQWDLVVLTSWCFATEMITWERTQRSVHVRRRFRTAEPVRRGWIHVLDNGRKFRLYKTKVICKKSL